MWTVFKWTHCIKGISINKTTKQRACFTWGHLVNKSHMNERSDVQCYHSPKPGEGGTMFQGKQNYLNLYCLEWTEWTTEFPFHPKMADFQSKMICRLSDKELEIGNGKCIFDWGVNGLFVVGSYSK